MKRLAFDLEYTNYTKRFNPYSSDKLLVVGAYDGKTKYFWNINHPDAEQSNLDDLITLLQDKDICLEGANLKSDIKWIEHFLNNYNILEDFRVKCQRFDILNFSDIYNLIDRDKGEKNSLEYLAYKFCKAEPWKKKIKINALDTEPIDTVKEYVQHDCIQSYNVATYFRTKIKPEKDAERILAFQKQCIPILIKMEHKGVPVDKHQAYIAGKEVFEEMNRLQKIIDKIAKRPVYIESHKDLPKLLYEELKFPVLMVSETTGNPSADTDALNELRYDINLKENFKNTAEGKKRLELLESIKLYRKQAKLWSTFLKPLPKFIEQDGKLHCNFNMGKGWTDPKHEKGTGTGRLSADNPNLQQIPALDSIRNLSVSLPRHKLIDADYSQLELVITAQITGDTELTKAIVEGKDIHTYTTAMIDNQDYDDIKAILDDPKNKEYETWKRKRWFRKRSGFGILYGMSPYHLTQLLKYEGIDKSMAEAKRIIEEWLDLYPSVKKARDLTHQEAAINGYVKSIFGLKLMTPHAKAQLDKELIQRNNRQAFNFKIQSAAAYVCLIAMLLVEQKHPDILLTQVHDSLLCMEKADKAEETVESMQQIMTKDVKIFMKDIFNVDFTVPLNVKIKESRKWMA